MKKKIYIDEDIEEEEEEDGDKGRKGERKKSWLIKRTYLKAKTKLNIKRTRQRKKIISMRGCVWECVNRQADRQIDTNKLILIDTKRLR